MPLSPIRIPHDLLTFGASGNTATLNRQQYSDFEIVTGEPTFTGDRSAASREAFAALQTAKRRDATGRRQRVYLGDHAVRLAYGRSKRKDELDCDVIGYLLHRGEYGFLLAEGKGITLIKAKDQFSAVRAKLTQLTTDADDPEHPCGAPTIGGLIVTNRLRYLEWVSGRGQWVAYVNVSEEPYISDRMRPGMAGADPSLQRDKVYLLDGPADTRDLLPVWAFNIEKQPFTVWEHLRECGTRGSFRPVLIGNGALQIFLTAQ